MFTNKDLKNLILPLFVEQFLLMFVGIADTFVVSFSSEADVSGVSLVTSFNTVLIFLFTALSSGGAVIISQYIGSKDEKTASRSSGQLLMISRFLSAAAVTVYCLRMQGPVRYQFGDIFVWDGRLLRKIMGIALPNGVENGVHQLVKVALSSMVALFGTYQIAANGVAQSIWSLTSIMGLAMAPVYTTVIGQCMGARDIDAANFYFKKLNKITLVLSVLWNALIFAITPLIVRYSAISAEAKTLVVWVLINNIFNGLAYPFAGSLGNGLRAAGDVKFTMIVSITLTIAARLLFSALFGLWLGWGVIGVAIGMSIDLVFRGAIFIWRLRSQKWTKFQVI